MSLLLVHHTDLITLQQDNFYAKGLTLRDLDGEYLNNFANYWTSTATSMPESRGWWFQLSMHGGTNSAVSKVAADATAYAHREKLFLLQLYESVVRDSDYLEEGFVFLDDWAEAIVGPLALSDWAMYLNYADANMDRTLSQNVFWGDNLPRLQALKAKYDPDEVFYYPQSLEAVEQDI